MAAYVKFNIRTTLISADSSNLIFLLLRYKSRSLIYTSVHMHLHQELSEFYIDYFYFQLYLGRGSSIDETLLTRDIFIQSVLFLHDFNKNVLNKIIDLNLRFIQYKCPKNSSCKCKCC